MRPVEAITTVELFPGLSAALLSLLRSLSPEDWERPTVCASWSVKDVVAHLLDINIRKLSYGRDRLAQRKSDAPITSNEDLIDHINRQNAEWVAVAQRIGPKLLVEFLELTDREVYEFFKTLAPDGPARTAVAWAGDIQSPNWFDIAREYTLILSLRSLRPLR